MEFKTLSVAEIQQNELDFLNWMQAGAGMDIREEMEYFGSAFYDDNEPFI